MMFLSKKDVKRIKKQMKCSFLETKTGRLPCLLFLEDSSQQLKRQFVGDEVALGFISSLVVIIFFLKKVQWWQSSRRNDDRFCHLISVFIRYWLFDDRSLHDFCFDYHLILTSFFSHETFTSSRESRTIVSYMSCTQTTLALFCYIIASMNEFHVTIETCLSADFLNGVYSLSFNPWPGVRCWESLLGILVPEILSRI